MEGSESWRFKPRTRDRYPAPYNYFGLPNGITDFKKLNDFVLATEIFCVNYESPATLDSLPKRIEYAHQDFSYFIPLIFLDPGHGGQDSGAYYAGIKESTINLSIAKMVKQDLLNLGYRVVMSREDDKDVSLLDRSKMANEIDAKTKIFVSIHNNAAPSSSSVNGIETYYYQYYPEYPPEINQEKHNDPVRLEESRKLAEYIQNEMVVNTGAKNRGVFRNTFAVLRESKMPAILLEGGFMTNPTELSKLITPSYQRKLANGIVTGIQKYFGRI